jgi:hypothetical protein
LTRRRPAGAVTELALLIVLATGCTTVDLGTPPADVNACRPSQQYFIDEIWPNVLSVAYGDKHCNDPQCHNSSAGRPLTLVDPTNAAAIPLPTDWSNNYRSTTEQMNCANVASSALLLFPTGQRPHGGGTLFPSDGNEATLIKAWITAP